MSYTRKQWLAITETANELIEAATRDDWADVGRKAKELQAYKPSNPDWPATAMQLTGSFLVTLPNPGAVLIGSTLIGIGRARTAAKAFRGSKSSRRTGGIGQ